jgi:bifunctional non-homologous end joining protein LigD
MEVHVVAFDLLFRNDIDLRHLPLIERKAALAKLVKGVSTIQLSLVHDDGEEIFKVAQEHGMEGACRFAPGRAPTGSKSNALTGLWRIRRATSSSSGRGADTDIV